MYFPMSPIKVGGEDFGLIAEAMGAIEALD
jgi:hypothetical protein